MMLRANSHQKSTLVKVSYFESANTDSRLKITSDTSSDSFIKTMILCNVIKIT